MHFRHSLLLHSLIVLTCEITCATALASPGYRSQVPLQDKDNTKPSWQQYVRSPTSNIVLPARVISSLTTGNVTNPNGLLNAGSGPTILTRHAHAPDVIKAAAKAADQRPTIVVDFGLNVAGILSISFAGASSNTPGIRLAFSETLEFLTDISDFTRSYNGDRITPGTDQIAVRSDPYIWTDNHGCQHGDKVCADGLHGFRYVKVYLDAIGSDAPYTSSFGQVSIESMSLNFSAFLGTPETFTGWFESSDDQLNQWWYDAVYTNDLCTDTFRENDTDPRTSASPSLIGKLVIHDGAKRDRDPYLGDLAVAGRTSFLSHDLSEATRNVLADLADHQRADGWIPPASINNYTLPLLDYPLWWVVCSYDLFMYTGDVAYVQTYYQTIVNVLDKFYPSITNPATNLVTKGFGVSGGYGDYAFLPRTGPVTYYNALYVLALDNAASIAKFLGGRREEDSTRWAARARKVSAAINEHLFDARVGAFFDGGCGLGPCDTHAQDGNSLSIVSGAANQSIAKSALSYLSTHNSRPWGNAFYDNDVLGGGFSQRVYAFMSYFEIEARFMTGLADSALDEIRRLYGWMSSHDPGVTFWEGIGSGGSLYEGSYTSMAHGWSSGITPALTNFVLGVMPIAPGFTVWSVKPVPGDVQWARGQVPTPYGPISVDWEIEQGKGMSSLSVTSPHGSNGFISVAVDDPASTSVFVDSEVAWGIKGVLSYGANYEDGYITVEVSGGHHTVTVGYA